MRVIVLGGTRFVGRAVTSALVAAGHIVLVAHRGVTEPTDFPQVQHLHSQRGSWPDSRATFAAFRPDAAIDVSAGNAGGAQAALESLPHGIGLIALSSVDVYRAYEALHSGRQTDAVPLTEDSPLRETRYLDGPQWENIEIEDAYLAAGATILRLGAVYGEHDYQYRFEPVLRRIRAGQSQLPVGTGSFLFSRVYVGDVARAVLATLENGQCSGECMNIVEAQTSPMRLFYEQVIRASGTNLELVRVADDALPPDLRSTGALSQHILASGAKARSILGWRDLADDSDLRRSVRWHMSHPPSEPNLDFTADEAALVTG